MMLPIVMALATFSLAPRDGCVGPAKFMFQVIRPGQGGTAVSNLQLRVERPRLDQTTPEVVIGPTESGGDAVLTLNDACPGDFVKVQVLTPGYRLIYPPERTPLGRGQAVVLVVCQPKSDCGLESREAVEAAVAPLRRDLLAASRGDRDAMLQVAKDYLSNQGIQSQELSAFMLRKERLIRATSDASTALNRYLNCAQELSDRFARQAVRAIDYPGSGPVDQINEAIRPYNDAFDFLKERGNAYAVEADDAWTPSQKALFKSLVDESLDIHARIHDLNGLKDLVNDIRHKVIQGKQADDARTRVREGTTALTGEVQARLQTLRGHVDTFLASRDQELLR